jgi:hypothetical protein
MVRADETGTEACFLGISAGTCRMWGARRPAGVGLRLAGDAFKVVVADAAGSALVELGPYGEDEVVAIWRSLSASSGLPLLVERADGTWDQAYPQIGRLVLGQRIERRRLAILSGRRPRFLVRRKPARLPRRPMVYREKEIATGRGR